MPEARTCAIYVRISDDRAGDAAGVGRQEEDSRALAQRQGWTVGGVYAENDRSAFKRYKTKVTTRHRDGQIEESTVLRVFRPEFRRMLDDLRAGVVDALVAYDLDRVARDPRDLEDLIDVVEHHHIPTRSVTGSLNLSTDSGITMARIMVTVANKSSRDTGRRVARKRLELAEQGKAGGGGIRAYGYERDGMTIIGPEADIIRELAGRIIGGESLDRLAKDLNTRQVPSVQGRRWTNRSVHAVITKARNAGLRTHRGEVVGEASWPAIIPVETWEQVTAALALRATGHSNKFTKWLNGVLICSACGQPLVAWSRDYWCAPRRGGCGKIQVNCAAAERVVEGWVLGILARPDVLAGLEAAVNRESGEKVRADAAEDQAMLDELGRQYSDRKISMAEYMTMRKPIVARLDQAKTYVRATVARGPLRVLLAADDIETAWAGTPPLDRREITRAVFPNGITVNPDTERPRVGGAFVFNSRRLVPVD